MVSYIGKEQQSFIGSWKKLLCQKNSVFQIFLNEYKNSAWNILKQPYVLFLYLISSNEYYSFQSFGGTKFENGFEKSEHLVN